jgi:uncharacterized cupin superfamily protein
VSEAELERSEHGLVPKGEGWFVLNAHDAQWWENELGHYLPFEGEERFAELGINLSVLQPGQPNSMYHREPNQEDFLVLSGECIAIVEGEERRLRAWDLLHCPAETTHVLVGAGNGPCVIVSVGSRARRGVVYAVDEAAIRFGAGVDAETSSPREAYGRFTPPAPAAAPDLP